MSSLSPGKLLELTQKWLKGTITPEETQLLDAWYNQQPPEQVGWVSDDQGTDALKERLFANISKGAFNDKKVIKLNFRRTIAWTAAACLLISIFTWRYFALDKQSVQKISQLLNHDIAPGNNQATLTLSNGEKIILTKDLSGKLATQGTTIIQADSNSIAYTNTQPADKISYNTLTTARGEQSPYPLVLADGTKVWLNAESSITFPTAFNETTRIVKITGEALFEVAHNVKQPFKVQTEKQTIEDIGTTFDVNAYPDESSTRTTLIEGRVKVNNIILKPGEQTDGRQVIPVNITKVVAWKDSKFRFIDDNIQTVMRQLARWYNIDVSYADTANSEGFNAIMSRNQNISVILSGLERTNGVHFKIEGRRVTVIK